MRPRTSPLDKSKVRSVYSGRPGCCCGCKGNHRYASAFRKASGKARGYPVLDDEVSDRSVSIIVNKLNRNIANGDNVLESPGLDGETFVSFETESRLLIAYFY